MRCGRVLLLHAANKQRGAEAAVALTLPPLQIAQVPPSWVAALVECDDATCAHFCRVNTNEAKLHTDPS